MAIEIAGFEMASSPLENGTHGENENGSLDEGVKGNQSIKFGSHENETVKGEGEGDKVQEAQIPNNVSDEWPMPRQIHSFYFVKYRTYDDPTIKAKMDQADKDIQEKGKARQKLIDELKAKRAIKSDLISQLKPLRSEDRKFRDILSEIKPLQQALRDSSNRGGGLCSSEDELNALIQSLNYRIQHESIPLSEEKQILKDIKQLEGTREKVIANAARRTQLQDSLVQKEAAIQDQVKLIGNDLGDVRKEQIAVAAKIKPINDQLQVLDDEVKSLENQLNSLTEKKDKAFEGIKGLRAQLTNGNAGFFDGRKVINAARNLAMSKDVKALEELCHAEIEKFMSQWSSSKKFRDDYKKRVIQSLDARQLSKDGRMMNPSEKPSREAELVASSKLETVVKASAQHAKEDSKPSAKTKAVPSQKSQKEATKKATELVADMDKVDVPEKEINGSEKLNKDLPAIVEISAEKLKEIKREEELAKARKAMERKKKMAEKAAAKAAIRAQKEAEKKLKEREKKAAKKAAASSPAINPEEPVEELSSAPEVEEEKVETPVPVVEKVKKESKIRNRNRARGPDSVQKALMKRKKSASNWVWAAVAAALLVILILAVLSYQYLN